MRDWTLSRRSHDRASIVRATSSNAEPGVDEQALGELEQQGLQVRRWPGQHHYFGGVSVVARTGIAGDPRRSGHAASLDGGS